ncbi:erythromycin esterase family protein [Streptomyces sp. NPDC002454]
MRTRTPSARPMRPVRGDSVRSFPRLTAVLLAAATVSSVLTGPVVAATGAQPVPAAHPIAAGAGEERAVVAALERSAHPLTTAEPGAPAGDLAPLVRMVGQADIVGVGEATHGSKELFQLKDRIFRQLVAARGFRTFALETSWSSGVLLDRYVRTGEGDLRRIMREEFQGSYADWNNAEFLRLFAWMRDHNRTVAPDRRLRVVGNDVNDVNHAQYARVLAWADAQRPALGVELRRLYASLLALPRGMGERVEALAAKPVTALETIARDARAAHALLEREPGADPWTLQEARVIADTATVYALGAGDPDPARQARANLHRDRAMAAHTVWWQRWTGDRIVVSAHNAHLGHRTPYRDTHPRVQGEFLREAVGERYLAVATSVHQARYRAFDLNALRFGVFSTGPAAPGSNEHLLDRVRHRDYYVDLRRVRRDGAAGAWLDTARPMFVVPSGYSGDPADVLRDVALGRTFDVLVHFRQVAEYGEVG